ncbi:MAG: hypothetical protein KAI95_18705, partial [Bacteroidales bacterium]|nr:hypothetical protein [Bacteroidales bacterium]
MKVFASVILFLFVLAGNLTAQDPVFKFWVQLNDKAGTPYSLDSPEEFLSQRSIERRQRFGIPLEWNDLPVSPRYIDSLQQHDLQVLYGSKWMNALIIETADSGLASQLSSKTYVGFVDFLFKTPPPSPKSQHSKWTEPASQMTEHLLSH